MDDDDGWLRGADGTVNATLENLRDLQSSCQDPAEDVEDLEDRLRSFFMDDSNYRGVETGNEFDASILDPDAFIAQMKDALGLDSSSSSVCSEEASTDWEEAEEDRHASRIPSGRTIEGGETTEDSDDDDEEFYREYGQRLKEELRQGMTSIHPGMDVQREDGKKVSEQEERHFQGVDSSQDLEWKTVENLLASYASQNGLPGPVSNFAGLFNIAVPDPEEEKGEEEATN